MDSFFGLGLAFALITGLVFMVPAIFILVVAFVYVRQHRGQPVDINTGATAYTVIIIGLGALLITLGVGQLLTAIIAEIDGDYTYGVASTGFASDFELGDADDFGTLREEDVDSRQEDDVATGLALFITGALAVGAHAWLRGWLAGQGRLDRGVEAAWDILAALVIGITAIALVGEMLDETLGRAISDDDTGATGSTIAQMFAVAALWVVYGYRALGHAGLFQRDATGGPGGGEAL